MSQVLKPDVRGVESLNCPFKLRCEFCSEEYFDLRWKNWELEYVVCKNKEFRDLYLPRAVVGLAKSSGVRMWLS